ncbi:MAG: enoyl-CoA hydratase/isomerase family protein [Halobacteriales archaeon]
MHEELETAEITVDEDTGVGHVLMNRPDKLNALSPQLTDDVVESLHRIREINDDADGVDVSVVVLEGAGGNFSSGADLMSFAGAERPFVPRSDFWESLRRFELPIVAKIEGYCLGGGLETALACDLRVAHEDATFGFPEIDIGLIPGAGGVHYVSRVAGEAAARELAYTADKVPADRARELGVVNQVYTDDEFDEAADDYAEKIASKAPLALQALKESVNMSLDVGLDEARAHDMRVFMQLLETDDFNAGISHFGQDSQPEFEGK